jgi:peptidylprolyl isomerase
MSPSKSRRRRPQKKKSNKKIILLAAFLAVIGLITIVVAFSGGHNSGATNEPVKVQLETSMGNIVIEMRDETPITSGNFENLTRLGLYDGTLFHRVVEGFVIQGGQLNTSVPTIPSEVIQGNNSNDRGTVAMALSGNPPDTNSATSQFFINLADNNDLDSDFTVFGRVVEGMDVVDQISQVETTGEPYNQPLEDVIVITATIVD